MLRTKIYFAEDDGTSVGTPAEQGQPTPVTSGDKVFKQEDVDKVAATARKEGREAALKALLAELGFEKPDELKSLVSEAKKKKEAEMSEVEKLNTRLQESERRAQEAETKAQQAEAQRLIDKRNSAIEKALSTAKYPDLIMGWLEKNSKTEGMMKQDGSIDGKAIEAAIAECKKAMPDLFRSDNPGSPSNAGAQPRTPDNKIQLKTKVRL